MKVLVASLRVELNYIWAPEQIVFPAQTVTPFELARVVRETLD